MPNLEYKICTECKRMFHGEQLKPLSKSKGRACRWACMTCRTRVLAARQAAHKEFARVRP